MDSKGSVNYKTAAEFNAAMNLAFQTALDQAPDAPALRLVSDKLAAATESWRVYDAAVSAGQDDAVRLEKVARQAQEVADTTLKKWYSGQWLGRQSRRGVL